MELPEALKALLQTVRSRITELGYEAQAGKVAGEVKRSLQESLVVAEPVLNQIPEIKVKIEACAKGELNYAELLIWLKENFDV